MESTHSSIPAADYELVEVSVDYPFWQLQQRGYGCVCPFSPAMPTQDGQGRMIAGQITCNTGCPLATVDIETDKENGRAHYTIGCGKNAKTFQVTLRPVSNLVPVPSIIKPNS